MNADFTFADVVSTLDHLVDLGVSHVYLSPIGTAATGSTHGYDWLPPPTVSDILGGLDGLRELRRAATERGLGLIIDIVPNHTGIAERSPTRGSPTCCATDRIRSTRRSSTWTSPRTTAPAARSPCPSSRPTATWVRSRSTGTATCATTTTPSPSPRAPGTHPRGNHARQHYKLVPWNSGLIGYRRFLTVNELAALRQEDPVVYDATHQWLRDLAAEDLIDGVRVDHPDGLWDPQHYLQRLRSDMGDDRLIYIEKILAPDEPLEPSLPVEGTTGYDQMRVIDGLFVAPSGVVQLTELHEHLTGETGDGRWIEAVEHRQKLTTLRESFPTELRRLVRTITHADPAADSEAIAEACGELIAALGVYRADYPSLRSRLETAAVKIAAERPELTRPLGAVVRATRSPGAASSRLAQTCGAVTAKSVEDSLFYRTARLVSAQEVGGDPANPALSVADFHEHNEARARLWPLAMTATSTHDTKRGEDVRARIALLSQVPERWSLLIEKVWLNTEIPDGLTAYFLLQNIFGVWPTDGIVTDELRTRLVEYARKACREAGLHTSWTEIDEEFEVSVERWIDEVTTTPVAAAVTELVRRVTPAWEQEALARKAIAILGPGVPDIYQGTEWWEDSLVDPDNRRPVDFSRPPDHPKTAMVRNALRVRAEHPEAFGPSGTYTGLPVDGAAHDHGVAFARGTGECASVVVITARFTHSLDPVSAAATTIELPAGRWRDVRGGAIHEGTVDLHTARAGHPVAILVRD